MCISSLASIDNRHGSLLHAAHTGFWHRIFGIDKCSTLKFSKWYHIKQNLLIFPQINKEKRRKNKIKLSTKLGHTFKENCLGFKGRQHCFNILFIPAFNFNSAWNFSIKIKPLSFWLLSHSWLKSQIWPPLIEASCDIMVMWLLKQVTSWHCLYAADFRFVHQACESKWVGQRLRNWSRGVFHQAVWELDG